MKIGDEVKSNTTGKIGVVLAIMGTMIIVRFGNAADGYMVPRNLLTKI